LLSFSVLQLDLDIVESNGQLQSMLALHMQHFSQT
jgi:hypothetical protein